MSLVPRSAGRPNVPDGRPSSVQKILSIFGTGIVVAVIGVAALLLIKEISDRKPPDLAVIRQHRIGQLTDDEIRKMHVDAESEFAKIQKEAASDGEAFWRRYSEECAKTRDDVAYRARHPDECRLPITWQIIGKPLDQRSIEQIFQGKMLGICNLISTIGEAKRYGCLPP